MRRLRKTWGMESTIGLARALRANTAPSILGTPVVGDIHIVDRESSKVFSGAYATQVVSQNIPAYWVIALLLKLPFVFQRVARQKPGCNGDACAVK